MYTNASRGFVGTVGEIVQWWLPSTYDRCRSTKFLLNNNKHPIGVKTTSAVTLLEKSLLFLLVKNKSLDILLGNYPF
eukprot:m.165801 g.165801  ORF g.165801 m.165801 type:complete len:77 (-) comp31397_c0_seq1:121-351(-)